jgi:hypothetical protein
MNFNEAFGISSFMKGGGAKKATPLSTDTQRPVPTVCPDLDQESRYFAEGHRRNFVWTSDHKRPRARDRGFAFPHRFRHLRGTAKT